MRLSIRGFVLAAALCAVPAATWAQTTVPAPTTQRANTPEQTRQMKTRVKILLDRAKDALAQGNETQANQYFSELAGLAREAWDNQDAMTCEYIFRQILYLRPENPEALFGLAELYRRTNPSWAIEYYNKYLQNNPSDPAARYGRGSCYLDRQAFSLAIEDLKYLVDRLEPNNVGGLTNLSLAYRGLAAKRGEGDPDPETFKTAVDYMEKAVLAAEAARNSAGDKKPGDNRNLADLRFRLGYMIFEYGQLMAKAKRAIPDLTDAITSLNYALGIAIQETRDNPEDRQLVDKIQQYLDALYEMHFFLSQIDPGNQKHYDELTGLLRSKSFWQNRTSNILIVGILKRAAEANPKLIDNWANLAGAYADIGDYKNIQEAMKQMAALDPQKAAQQWVGLSQMFFRGKNAKHALEALDQAIKLDPKNEQYKKIRAQLVAQTQPAVPLTR